MVLIIGPGLDIFILFPGHLDHQLLSHLAVSSGKGWQLPEMISSGGDGVSRNYKAMAGNVVMWACGTVAICAGLGETGLHKN